MMSTEGTTASGYGGGRSGQDAIAPASVAGTGTFAGLYHEVPPWFDDFPPSFPNGPRVLTWRKIDRKKTQVFWVAAVYIDNDKQVVFNHENPIEAFAGAVREFTRKVMPTLPPEKRKFFSDRLTKAAVAQAKAEQLDREHRRS